MSLLIRSSSLSFLFVVSATSDFFNSQADGRYDQVEHRTRSDLVNARADSLAVVKVTARIITSHRILTTLRSPRTETPVTNRKPC